MASRTGLAISVLLVACTGGPGSLSDAQTTQDGAPLSNEGATSTAEGSSPTNEGVARTNDEGAGNSVEGNPSPGSGGGGGTASFNCVGTYSCTTSGSSKTATISLPACSYQGAGFLPDGTVTQDGKVVGTWSPNGTGFTLTESVTDDDGKTISISGSCTKTSDTYDPNANGDDDDDSASADAGVP